MRAMLLVLVWFGGGDGIVYMCVCMYGVADFDGGMGMYTGFFFFSFIHASVSLPLADPSVPSHDPCRIYRDEAKYQEFKRLTEELVKETGSLQWTKGH